MMNDTVEFTTGPAALCVRCCDVFSISQEEADWIRDGEGQLILCASCWHVAIGIDEFTDGENEDA